MTREADFAKDLAARAGTIMREYFHAGVASRAKGDGSPVTAADEAINALALEAVGRQFPDDGFIGEEGSSPASSSGRVWVCDPIDGTLPFTFGVPTNLFSLALVDDGVPVLGVLYDPYLDRLYEATRGGGAYANGRAMAVNQTALRGACLSLPASQFGLADNAALFAAGLAIGVRVLAVGSITYESMLVAAGQLTACVFPAESVWDVAAVKVLVEEAGGRVTDLMGEPQRYDGPVRGALISNGTVHEALAELVRPHLRTGAAQ